MRSAKKKGILDVLLGRQTQGAEQKPPSHQAKSSAVPLANDDQPIVLKGHSDQVWSVAFSPSDQLLASGSGDKTIRLWDPVTGAEVAILNGHSSKVYALAFSPDGATIASGSQDTSIKLWDVGSRKKIATLRGHSNTAYSLEFSPDGAYLASGSSDKTVQLWDVKSKTSIIKLAGHKNEVNAVAFSPDGRIASGSNDETIRLWDVSARKTTAILKGHEGWVRSIAFSPSGLYLASGSSDKTIRLWDVTTGAHSVTLTGHSGVVGSVAFSPSGQYLATGSFDKTIRLWDVASRSCISILEGHESSVLCVAFSYNGFRLASGSHGKTVRVWPISLRGLNDPRDMVSTSYLTVSSQGLNSSQQDATISPSRLNNDITSSVSLESGTLIGYGGFGDLFLGVHKDHGKVALKKPRRVLDEALIRRFLREVDLWCSVSHRYILPCLGTCKIGLDVYVVSPFIENGDLMTCMTRGMVLNCFKLLFEVAEALTHLHHRGIIHGDVKAQNVLLANDGSALLCDFGLAKAFDTMATSTESKGAGSVRWMAPELFQDESRSMASDVYSLGITIAEILSGRAPYLDISSNLAVMRYVADQGGRPPKDPLNSPEGKSYAVLWETAEKCWVKDAKARPNMAQVLGMLFPLTREMTRITSLISGAAE